MTNDLKIKISEQNTGEERPDRARAGRRFSVWKLAPVALIVALSAGCQSPSGSYRNAAASGAKTTQAEAIILREGDVLRVTFPGSPNLDAQSQPQPVRRDGNITLPLIGEVRAAGLTPSELEKELLKSYATQLVSKAVTVTVVSSAYAVYVTGAVLRPGKVSSDHPITALEAIMEAGGFDYTKANLKEVTVIRQEGGATKKYVLDMKSALKSKTSTESFYLKPSDIVYVPERFVWF